MKKPAYWIKTFGCQMNFSDSERIAGFLEVQEIKIAKDIDKAGIVIFNTCGVRQMAEDRAYGLIHNLHKTSPKTKIILTGCLAERKDVRRKLKNKVDLFFPISNFEIFENWIVDNYSKIGNPLTGEASWKLEIPAQKNIEKCLNYLSINPKYAATKSAYVPVMTGCNNFCSYCVVPYARGREISRPKKEIISEIKNLIRKNTREIILLGQNVNSYLDGKTNFSKLLEKINAIPGNFRVSFVSSHPKDYSDELIETATKLRKVCEYIHLPIQSGDDKILEKMNRKYTQRHYLGLIRKIKAAFKKNKPGVPYAISSDIIVGFPGETKRQFLESAEVMEKIKYDMVFFGQFSPRPGTAAYTMKDNVSKSEKVSRENYLNGILAKTSFSNNKKYVGKIIEVLVEKEKGGYFFGKTRTWKNVKIHLASTLSLPTKQAGLLRKGKEKSLIGKLVKVKITKANIWNLEACFPKK